jgi:hypothetical protein
MKTVADVTSSLLCESAYVKSYVQYPCHFSFHELCYKCEGAACDVLTVESRLNALKVRDCQHDNKSGHMNSTLKFIHVITKHSLSEGVSKSFRTESIMK